MPSRHNYRVPTLQQNVLREIAALGHLAVAEPNGVLFRAVAMQYANPIGAGERGNAAGKADGLHHIDRSVQGKITGTVHLADDEDFAQSAGKAGLTYPQLIDRIIRLGMNTVRG